MLQTEAVKFGPRHEIWPHASAPKQKLKKKQRGGWKEEREDKIYRKMLMQRDRVQGRINRQQIQEIAEKISSRHADQAHKKFQ